MSRPIGAHVSAAGGPALAVARAVDIGADCLQIFAGSPRSWSRSLYSKIQLEKYQEAKKALPGPLFIHALYLINLASSTPDNLQKSQTSLITDLKNGELLNSAGVVVHIGSHLGQGFDSVKHDLVLSLTHILESTHNTPLLLENTSGQKGKIGTLAELSYLIKTINSDRLKICLDTAHLFEGGLDLNDIDAINDFVHTLKDLDLLTKLSLVHLNDSKTALGSTKDEHDNLGHGQIGPTGLSNFINHPQLNHLPLVLEVPGFDGMGPDKQNIDIARSLLR